MSKHNETGLKGEQIAQKFLAGKGYTILFVNWRYQRNEVDIIAQKNDLLIFTEVKTRSGVYFGFPEDAVNKKKQEMLRTAALAFLGTYPDKQQLRFDVISIHMDRDREPAITHIEDAFY